MKNQITAMRSSIRVFADEMQKALSSIENEMPVENKAVSEVVDKAWDTLNTFTAVFFGKAATDLANEEDEPNEIPF
jgi:hypothetical protein